MDQLQNNTNEHHVVPSYEASFQDSDPTNQIIPSAPPPGIEENDPELQPQPSDIRVIQVSTADLLHSISD